MRALALALVGVALLVPFVPAPAAPAPSIGPLVPPLPHGVRSYASLPSTPEPPITLGADVIVPEPSNQDEFSIAANPLDQNNLVAGANDYGCCGVGAGFFTTLDGGKTWTHGFIPTPGHTCGGDPALAFDKFGTAWYIGITGFCGDGASTIFASKSTDGGLHWTTLYPVVSTNGEFEDKPYVTTDAATGDVIITWTVFGNGDITFIKSSDHGLTWSPRVTLGGGQFSEPVVAPDGDIYVTWAAGSAQFARSTDGGQTFQTFPTPLRLSLPSGVVAFRYNPTPTIAVAPAGSPHAGRIYLAGPMNNGQQAALLSADIAVVTSDDGGQHWSAPDFITRPGVPLMPWMAITADGTVGVAYMDTVLTPGSGTAAGRQTGTIETLLEQSLSTKGPNDPAWSTTITTDWPSDAGAAGFWGDYQGLVATSSGFHPAWGDARDTVCGSCGNENGFPDFATANIP